MIESHVYWNIKKGAYMCHFSDFNSCYEGNVIEIII